MKNEISFQLILLIKEMKKKIIWNSIYFILDKNFIQPRLNTNNWIFLSRNHYYFNYFKEKVKIKGKFNLIHYYSCNISINCIYNNDKKLIKYAFKMNKTID